MGSYGVHLRFNEHDSLIKHSFVHHVSVRENVRLIYEAPVGFIRSGGPVKNKR